MTQITINGYEFDFDAIVNLMDDDIREDLHMQGFDTEQEFVNAYVTAHRAKFGEDFVIN